MLWKVNTKMKCPKCGMLVYRYGMPNVNEIVSCEKCGHKTEVGLWAPKYMPLDEQKEYEDMKKKEWELKEINSILYRYAYHLHKESPERMKTAADEGKLYAIEAYGLMCLRGQNMEQDIESAYIYLAKAKELGSNTGRLLIDHWDECNWERLRKAFIYFREQQKEEMAQQDEFEKSKGDSKYSSLWIIISMVLIVLLLIVLLCVGT